MKATIFLVLNFSIFLINASSLEGKESFFESLKFRESFDKLKKEPISFSMDIQGRVTNGQPAERGEFPYQVYMILTRDFGAAFLCGGSIIHRRWILSAAHCVLGVVKIEVYFGAVIMERGTEGSAIKVMTVTRNRSIIQHPGYNSKTKANDVALVELPEDAPIENSYVGLLELPKGLDATRNYVGLQATVSGFGKSSDISNSNIRLNYVTLTIASNAVCENTFGSVVTNDHVCLSSVEKRSACSGDSGGPLTIIGSSGTKIQVGIVSFGAADGCEKNFPQVFARVSSFIPWIEQMTAVKFS